MMVKNESQYIKRCLDSVKPLIDMWSIVDTGSTDGTQDVIRKEMAGVPGQVWERPWVNWNHNRMEVIELAKKSGADFLLLIDADQKAAVNGKWELNLDCMYWCIVKNGAFEMKKPFILSSKHKWHYVGATHEYLTCDPDIPTHVTLPVILEESGRTKTKEYFLKDAEILEAELFKDPDNARNMFYLAQSYRDAGDHATALEHYQRRINMGGWREEVWYSLYQVGILKMALGQPADQVIMSFIHAYEYNPHRAESLGVLARYAREKNMFNLAYLTASRGLQITVPDDKLFMDLSQYEWRLKDEYALAAYYTGRYTEAANAWASLLNGKKLPVNEIDRVKKNWDFAKEKLK